MHAHPDAIRWRELTKHPHLGLLIDLDGTLIEFAPRPEQAVLDEALLALLRDVAAAGIHLAIVSGRSRATIEPYVDRVPEIWWIAEHGSWWYRHGDWLGPTVRAEPLSELVDAIAPLLSMPGARGLRLERKSLSVCVHWREVEAPARAALVATLELVCDEWLETQPDFERLPGVEVLEVRHRSANKGVAVRRMRALADDMRLIAIGDDVTDEDMFAELAAGDAAIGVGPRDEGSRAQAALAGPGDVRIFLRWLVECRRGVLAEPVPVSPALEPRRPRQRGLVVISNRTPPPNTGRTRQVGGLVSALEPALRDGDGIWLGWSGHAREGSQLVVDNVARPARAAFDLKQEWYERFYGGFCNRVLWPLFHGFPSRVRYRDEDWHAYVAANRAYAEHALQLARPDATIWVHDYHLLLVARHLRARGHRGPIGLFLHIPFPPRELVEQMPWHAKLVDAMLDFDLVGLHTERWAENFRDTVRVAPGTHLVPGGARNGARTTSVGVFPIAIDHEDFARPGEEAPDVAGLRTALRDRRLVLGVDRLDYSKGIPERLAGFERLLELHPEWRGRICLVQVSVPSRSEIPEYAELKRQVETIVGRINGRYGEADWVPVRYLYRSYDQGILAQLYRLADLALVTPLRDGMNLVAKEFVAAQDPARPGVLVLSRFAGAADELTEAVITNPFHVDGLAADLDHALRLPLDERVRRHAQLERVVRATTPATWAASFLDKLAVAARTAALARSPAS